MWWNSVYSGWESTLSCTLGKYLWLRVLCVLVSLSCSQIWKQSASTKALLPFGVSGWVGCRLCPAVQWEEPGLDEVRRSLCATVERVRVTGDPWGGGASNRNQPGWHEQKRNLLEGYARAPRVRKSWRTTTDCKVHDSGDLSVFFYTKPLGSQIVPQNYLLKEWVRLQSRLKPTLLRVWDSS